MQGWLDSVAEKLDRDRDLGGRWSSPRSAATSTTSSSAATPASSGASIRPSSTRASPRACPRAPTATTAISPTPTRRCRKHGYTRMFEKMLGHPNIKIMLNTDYREIVDLRAVEAHGLHRPDRRLLQPPARQAALPQPRVPPRQPGAGAVPAGRHGELSRTTTPTRGSASSSTSPDSSSASTSIVYEYPQAEGDPVLSGAAAGERRALPALRGRRRAAAPTSPSSAASRPTSTTTWTRWSARR